MNYSRNLKNTFVTKLFGVLVSFLISIVLARALGAPGRGYLQYLLLIVNLFSQFGQFGITNATTHFQKKFNTPQDILLSSNSLVLFFIWIFEFIIILLLRNSELILHEYKTIEVFIGFLIILASYFVTLITAIDTGNNNIIRINRINLLGLLLKLILLVILYLLNYLRVMAYLLLLLVHMGIQLILFIIPYRKEFKLSLDFGLIFNEMKFGIVLYFASLFIYLNYRADQFMISSMLSVADLGVYAIAVTISELIFTIPNSVLASYRGKIYNIKSHNNDEFIKVTSNTTKYTLLISLLVSIIVFVFSPLISYLYGKEFYGAIRVVQIMLPGVVGGTIGKVLANYFVFAGRAIIHLTISIITFALNIILNLFFIKNYGINGAALASTISYIFYGLAYLLLYMKKCKVHLTDVLIINKRDIKFLIDNVLAKKK